MASVKVDVNPSILSWVKHRNYRLVRGMAFESEFEGLRCICSNMAQGQSDMSRWKNSVKHWHSLKRLWKATR